MKINLASIRQRWSQARLKKSAAVWIALGAIILTVFLGFSRGGWVTGGTASTNAERTSQNAVIQRLVPICVVQFNQDPLRDQKLEEMTLVTSVTQRIKYVEDQGWATMPGEANPDSKVAIECANEIMLLSE
jgi:hypothetical protein